jgi:hypothetical protein
MRAKWLSRTLTGLPLRYTLVTSVELLRKELKRLGIPKHRDVWDDFPTGTKGACVHQFTTDKGSCAAIVCVRTDVEGDTGCDIASRIVHEAMHVWRWAREILGESNPSSEFEAYAMENLTRHLFEEYARQTGGKP